MADDGDAEMDSDTDAGGADDAMDLAAGGTVTVGDEQFALPTERVCLTMGGAFGASLATEDGAVTFDLDLPPEGWDGSDDWEPPSVRLDDERDDTDEHSWRAGGEVVSAMEGLPPEVMVTSYSIDGSTASGTAIVVDLPTLMIGEPQTAEMTFAVTCG